GRGRRGARGQEAAREAARAAPPAARGRGGAAPRRPPSLAARAPGTAFLPHRHDRRPLRCDGPRRRPARARRAAETQWAWGTIPGSRTLFVADLPRQLATIPRHRTCWVICSHGHRASIAAGLVAAARTAVPPIGAG